MVSLWYCCCCRVVVVVLCCFILVCVVVVCVVVLLLFCCCLLLWFHCCLLLWFRCCFVVILLCRCRCVVVLLLWFHWLLLCRVSGNRLISSGDVEDRIPGLEVLLEAIMSWDGASKSGCDLVGILDYLFRLPTKVGSERFPILFSRIAVMQVSIGSGLPRR